MFLKYIPFFLVLISFNVFAEETGDNDRNQLDEVAEKENMDQNVYNAVLDAVDEKERKAAESQNSGSTISK